VQKLLRFTDAVVFSFDGDAAGRRAAHKALEAALPFATDVRSVKFLFLPPEHDPDSYVRAHGREAFAEHGEAGHAAEQVFAGVGGAGLRPRTAPRAVPSSPPAPRHLWMQLPEGALKMQIFADIAALVQIGPRELGCTYGAMQGTGARGHAA
jgi:DNA primase